ncbi:uncharacterized protein LOC134244904 [Saccostrea cucullata]|uniref:uncharacterized protein LOC134244904 n=1 Tax=Saccostrea cuccullata TaxID=36930 RepID=UPI002ED2F2F5
MNGTCQPKTCINGTWSNNRRCSCELDSTTTKYTQQQTSFLESSISSSTTRTFLSTDTTRVPSTTSKTILPTFSTSTVNINAASPISTSKGTTLLPSISSTVTKTAQTSLSSTHNTPANPHLPHTFSRHTTDHNRVSQNPTTPFARTKEQNDITTDDNSVMLKSVYNSIKMMWVSVGGGVIIIIIIVLITSFVVCFKMRSKSKGVKDDESTSFSSEGSNGLRKYAGTPPRSCGGLRSETNNVYSDYNEGSNYSLPRYNIHKSGAHGYFDCDRKILGNPAREQRGYY